MSTATVAPVDTHKILSHPTRGKILDHLAKTPFASPAQIAKVIGRDVGLVGYHMRKLLEVGYVELVDEKPVRGAVEHFYAATAAVPASAEVALDVIAALLRNYKGDSADEAYSLIEALEIEVGATGREVS